MTCPRLLIGLLSVAVLLCCTTTAEATLVIDITGFGGSGHSTWTFLGSSTTSASDSILTSSSSSFNSGSDGEFGNIIANSSIQDDLFAVMSGSATIKAGTGEFAITRNITHIFLDHDSIGPSDVGIRVNSELSYPASLPVSWSGSVVVPIDVSDLRGGSYTNSGSGPFFAFGPGAVHINVPFGPTSPEPASLAMMGVAVVGGIGLSYCRRRWATRPVQQQ